MNLCELTNEELKFGLGVAACKADALNDGGAWQRLGFTDNINILARHNEDSPTRWLRRPL